MKFKKLSLSLLALSAVCLTSCNRNGFNEIKDQAKKAEIRTALTSINMPDNYMDVATSSTTNGVFAEETRSRYFNSTIDINLSFLMIDYHLYGTAKGININRSDYYYMIELHDSKLNNILSVSLNNSEATIKTYEYKILNIQILPNTTSTAQFDDTKLIEIGASQTLDFMNILNFAQHEDFAVVSKEVNKAIAYALNITKTQLLSLAQLYLGLTSVAAEYIDMVNNIYLGPTIDTSNYIVGLNILASITKVVTIDIAAYVTIINEVPTITIP